MALKPILNRYVQIVGRKNSTPSPGISTMDGESRIEYTRERHMRKAVWLVTGLAIAWAAYSLAPDFRRYMRIRAM